MKKRLAHNVIDHHTGERFDKLTVLKRSHKTEDGHWVWLCKCDCGKRTKVVGSELRRSRTRSCGCSKVEFLSESSTTHGQTIQRRGLYQTWCDMKARCYNPNIKAYPNYGGRGITVCARWLESFENFYEDMGATWEPGLTLDRRNPDGNYNRRNCRWLTKSEHSKNGKKRRKSKVKGKAKRKTKKAA